MTEGNIVYSTNKDLKNLFQTEKTEYDKTDFVLSVCFEKKGRGGKGVTIIKGFQGNEEKLEEIGKNIKKSLGIGGSTKNKEIILQGRIQEKIIQILHQKGYKAKKVGG